MTELVYQENSNIVNEENIEQKDLIESLISSNITTIEIKNNLNNSNNDVNINTTNYNNLERIRKHIETLSSIHHIEIGKILKNNNVKLTENNNGLFVNLNNIDSSIIDEIQNYLNFVNLQENNINAIEEKKQDLQKIYF